jgi:hypothetical protein
MFPLCAVQARRAAAGAAALLLSVLAFPASAPATSGGSISGTSSVTAVAWGVVPAATSVTSDPPCRSNPGSCGSFTSSGLSPWYFNVWNTGTTSLAGLTYSISFAGGVAPTVTLTACSVAWTTGVLPLCTGVQTTVLSGVAAGTYPVTVGVPSTAGSEVFIQASPGGLPSSFTVTTTVGSGAPRQIRAASTTDA